MQQNFSDPISDIKIRQATLDDIPKIIDINLKTLPENYSTSFYEDILINYPETFIVAENDEKIIGYIMCRIEYGLSSIRTLNLARKGHIVSIALLEAMAAKSFIFAHDNIFNRDVLEKNAFFFKEGFPIKAKLKELIAGFRSRVCSLLVL